MTIPTYVTREEFEARVGVLEREVDGEKLVSRYTPEQARHNGEDLGALKSQFSRFETRLDGVDKRIERVEQKIDGLARSLPGSVADAMREVERERRERDGR